MNQHPTFNGIAAKGLPDLDMHHDNIMIYHDISQIIISWKQYSTATHMASEKAYCVSLCVASTSHVRHGQMVKWPWHDCPCLRDGGMIRSPKETNGWRLYGLLLALSSL